MVQMNQATNPAPPPNFTGRGKLSQLVAELERQKASKVDFVTDLRSLRVDPAEANLVLAGRDNQTREWITQPSTMRRNALIQLGQKLNPDVPGKFLQELVAGHSGTAANLLNDLIDRSAITEKKAKRVFVRLLDGEARAILSDSYRTLDHFDIAFVAMEAAKQCKAKVIEATLTENTMNIKFTTEEVWDAIEFKRGPDGRPLGNHDWLNKIGGAGGFKGMPLKDGRDGTIFPCVTISNSETGFGRFSVQVGILAAICTNMAMIEESTARVHLGEKLEVGVFRPETLNLDSQTIMAKAGDVITAAFTPEGFAAIADRCRAANDLRVVAPAAAIANIVASTGLASIKEAQERILAYFLADYDPTAYGLAQAVSRLAQDTEDADAAADIETAAGKVIAKPELALAVS